MENLIISTLKKDTDYFNNKTFGIEEFKKNIKTLKIFRKHKKLTFLPDLFHIFLETYAQYPDRYIHIYDYYDYRHQYYKNMVMPKSAPIRYFLFHRIIYRKVDEIKIQFIFVSPDKYAVAVNADFIDPIDTLLTFEEALCQFYKNQK